MATDAAGVVLEYLTAWNAHDTDRLLALFADDCVDECIALGRLERGEEQVRSLVQSASADLADFRMEVTAAFGEGDWGATGWTMTGRSVHSIVPGLWHNELCHDRGEQG